MSWWASIERPTAQGPRRFLVELGNEPDAAALAALRAEYSIPDDWMERRVIGEPWEFAVAPGEPHPERMWSNAELRAAKEQLENAAGIPQQLQAIRDLEGQLDAAKDALPVALLKPFLDELQKARRALKQIRAEDLSVALASTPPSRATVKRKPA